MGHLRAAEEVIEALELERMVFVPSSQPPHKPGKSGDPIAAPADRLTWLRAALRDNPRFEVDPLEVERGGPSFSVDTLRALADRLAPERPVFVIGRDAFREIGSWREPQALFTLAHFAVISRPGSNPRGGGAGASLDAWLPESLRGDLELDASGLVARHRRAGTWLRLLEIAALDVSASEIRARLRAGRSVRYLLPEAIHDEVVKSGVYTDGPE